MITFWTLYHFYFELTLIENWHTIYVSSRSADVKLMPLVHLLVTYIRTIIISNRE